LPKYQVDLCYTPITWQPRHVMDTLTNWQWSFHCCCTESMEQATDETAGVNKFISL